MSNFDVSKKDEDLAVGDVQPTILNSLREELKRKIKNEPITIAVPNREGISVQFNCNIELGILQQWRKRSADKSMLNEFDPLKFSSIVLANQSESVYMNGVIAIGEDGEPLTLRHPEFIEMLGASKAIEAVKALYGVDGHIIQIAERVISASGFGEMLEEGNEVFTN